MLHLAGYQETEPLYTGTRTEVYRAIRLRDRQPAIVKVLRNSHPNFNELVQFRHQYIVTRHLEHPAIVRPLALEPYGHGYALIMPDNGAIALADYWQEGDRSLTEFLATAIQLADALHYLNQQRIVHKDIKPTNILIHPKTHQAKLIDFSIATLLPKEQQQLINLNILEGTLAYISPEQTGRMNRGIDYRTDFYSLGVTFYELLTGKLPFISDDPMELVHCHIAKTPILPTLGSGSRSRGNRSRGNRSRGNTEEIPQVLIDIVLKLMAKNAEDRYQSALGLKHDLEQCLQQLQTTGEIARFEIGQRDICDRFLIPEKLYGRSEEVQTLLGAFDRLANGTTEMMLVAGFSGIGKTAVVNEVHKPIVRQRGYFIKGKCDQFNRNIPFDAFVQAFRYLMEQLLGESDSEIAQWKTKIISALGDSARVIIDVIPELERIIGQQSPAPELSGSAAQNRFNLLFNKFVRLFATKEHPLVIFLDDLQWADSASLNLLKLLMDGAGTGYLLVLGAYRDNEVFPAHPLMLTLNKIQKQEATLNTLTLSPLSETDVTSLVADTLLCSGEIAAPLSQLVYQKTQGNPFFTIQFLRSLYEDSYIKFNTELLYWQCNLAQVRQFALTEDVVQFIMGRLHKLSPDTRGLLELAACIGNEFNLETLAIVREKSLSETADDLWSALAEGLILPQSEICKFYLGDYLEDRLEETRSNINNHTAKLTYKFLHDRVQQAAYALIPDRQKQATHYHIGQLLLAKISPEAIEERIFELVGQLNYGTALITDQKERDELARFNLMACRKARSATAYQAGGEYASIGLSLLGEDAWQRQYEMCLAFHELAAELASLCGDFEAMEQLISTAIARAKSLLEQVNVYRIKIQASVSQNRLTEAIAIAQQFLQQLGVTFPDQPTQDDIRSIVAEIDRLIGDREIADLINLPLMGDRVGDREKIVIVQITNSIIPVAYICQPTLFPILIALSVKLSIQYGNTAASAFSYACYGIIACTLLQDVDTGVKFGQLALQVVSKLDAKTVKPEVNNAAGLFIFHRKYPLKSVINLLQDSYTGALEVGNYELAGYCAQNVCLNSFWSGQPLTTLEQETRAYSQTLGQLNQLTTANYCRIYWQSILNLLGLASPTIDLAGEALQETKLLPQFVAAHDFFGLYLVWLYKLMLCYLFGEIELANNHAGEARQYLIAGTGMVSIPGFYFYDSLTALAALSIQSSAASELLQRVEENQTQLQQQWANYAPMNHQHKVDLVAAEKYRVLGQKAEAIEMYDRAIAGAKENGFIQEEALANELAAKFYSDWGKEKIAATYMIDAYYCYARWGAKAKTDRLEQKYPQLLSPILQKQQAELSGSNSIDRFTQTLVSNTYTQSSSTALSNTLDFTSLLQAAGAVSSNLELDPLLADISRIILMNSGAEKAVLLIPSATGWQLRAIARVASDGTVETSTKTQPLTVDSPVPIRSIQYVKNTQKPVLINEAKTEIDGTVECYLLKEQPQSVLCVPLLNQGNLVAILYLEHSTTKGVFTTHRQTVVKLLCTQAAISLQNAQLYEQAQQAFRDLQQAQLQLVQSEKMSALGNLMAGVAHEINNPTGFLQGNIQPAREYVQDLLDLIDFLRENLPTRNRRIEKKIEAIDLEFIREDLPKLLESMDLGVERIRSISKSLRTFARTDRDRKIKFNIHEGIESTLLILKHRTKAGPKRPQIQVIINYGDLPEVQCFPGQLNQVFMNILANAIDAFESANQGKTYAEITANPNCITIHTSVLNENQVQIQIQDNGCGMKPETQKRIFEQGFTTKEVGKGTGLGMAIAHQIVTEKHQGTITCTSELGRGTTFTITLSIGGQ